MKELSKVTEFWGANLKSDDYLYPGEDVYFPILLKGAANSHQILEVGVGTGRMVKILRKNGIHAQFYGVDVTANVERSGTISTIADARSLPYHDSTFDLVYSLGVVEHFPETDLAIMEHARVVKKGGMVLVTTPHLSLFTPTRYLAYHLKYRKRGTFEEILGKNLKISSMRDYFIRAKLTNIQYGYFGLYGLDRILGDKFIKFRRAIQSLAPFGSFLFMTGRK